MYILYEKVASKVTSAEPPGRGNGTDQLGCLTVPGRFHYPSPGAAWFHFLSCHAGYKKSVALVLTPDFNLPYSEGFTLWGGSVPGRQGDFIAKSPVL